jgi:hypothetical protein
MTALRLIAMLAALAAAVLAGACGKSEEVVDPLLGKAAEARAAQAMTSLQQALTAAALVRTEAGGTFGSGAEDLAQRLQARDPSKRYSTAPSAGSDQIQVLGGGGAALLVARANTDSFVAVWDDGGGSPMYYHGAQPPPFSAQRPAGGGWSTQPLR